MSIEDRLRDAYQAKTMQLTEQRLAQLTATRGRGLHELRGSEHTTELPVVDLGTARQARRHRWIAPALAAAAVAAVAIGAVVITTDQPDAHPRPNPPATRYSSAVPSSSAPAPSTSASQTHSQTVTGPPYLPAGQTGSRGQVPWSVVGSGWRLLQQDSADLRTVDRSLYLYDPADGRYLITDRLPAEARLVGWSPDGARAMLQAVSVTKTQSGQYRNHPRLYQMELRSGTLKQLTLPDGTGFSGYTQPRGLAFLTDQVDSAGTWRLSRYSTDGSLELSYPTVIDGHALSSDIPRYTPDGTELIVPAQPDTILLLGNDGHFIRAFQPPAGYSSCQLVKLWTAAALLESCYRPAGDRAYSVLLVQPLSGGTPQVLIDAKGRLGGGYQDAWQLSNGAVLLSYDESCGQGGAGGYDVLHPNSDAVTALRGPAGMPSSPIVAMDGDLATFLVGGAGCTDHPSAHTLIDYNMVTGQTRTLLQRSATILPWPGDAN